MAAINDLIAQVADDSLREKLEREVNNSTFPLEKLV